MTDELLTRNQLLGALLCLWSGWLATSINIADSDTIQRMERAYKQLKALVEEFANKDG